MASVKDLTQEIVTDAFMVWAEEHGKDVEKMPRDEVAMWMLGYVEAMKIAFRLFDRMEYKKDDSEHHGLH